MAPFGVRVHSVITGGVDTAICDGNIKTSLGDSFYDVDGVYESIRSSAMMSRDLNISPEQYAKEVVRDIVSWRDPGFNLYHGARSYFCIGLVVSCPCGLLNLVFKSILNNAEYYKLLPN